MFLYIFKSESMKALFCLEAVALLLKKMFSITMCMHEHNIGSDQTVQPLNLIRAVVGCLVPTA